MSAGDLKNGSNLDGGIVAQTVLTTSAVALYTVPTNPASFVKLTKVVFANESGAATTVTYGVVKSGGTAGAAGTSAAKNAAIDAAGGSLATLDATELAGMYLGPGDAVWGLAGAGSAVAVTVSGIVSH